MFDRRELPYVVEYAETANHKMKVVLLAPVCVGLSNKCTDFWYLCLWSLLSKGRLHLSFAHIGFMLSARSILWPPLLRCLSLFNIESPSPPNIYLNPYLIASSSFVISFSDAVVGSHAPPALSTASSRTNAAIWFAAPDPSSLSWVESTLLCRMLCFCAL